MTEPKRKGRKVAGASTPATEQQQRVPTDGIDIADVLLANAEQAGWEWFIVQDREGMSVTLSCDIDESTVVSVHGKAQNFFNALGKAAADGQRQLNALQALGIALSSAFDSADVAASEGK